MKKPSRTTLIISISTIVLAGVAVFTAMRLYQLRSEPVAPNVPESEPEAQTAATIPPPSPPLTTNACEDIVFTLSLDEPTPTATATTRAQTPTPTATATTPGQTTNPTPTATATAPGQTANPTPTSTSSIASQPTPTSTSTVTNPPLASGPTTTPSASLPPAGYATPTIIGLGAGLIILIFSILLAL